MPILYKGYEIKSTSIQLQEKDKWTTSVSITQHTGDHATIFPFSAGNTFGTKEDADAHSINFGKQIIDGNYPGLSLSTK